MLKNSINKNRKENKTMKYTVEINTIADFPAWDGGLQRLERAIALNDVLTGDETEGEINDILWFDEGVNRICYPEEYETEEE